MFELEVLQVICNKINSNINSEGREYFNSELEKIYPTLIDVTLTDELVSKSQLINQIDEYITKKAIVKELNNLDVYSSFYSFETYEKAMELYGIWYKKTFDKITNNLFKKQLDKSVDADNRKLLLIQLEYIYDTIYKNIIFVSEYVTDFLDLNSNIIRFANTQFCDLIIKLIDWQIESGLYSNVWSDFFTKHLFYNGRKHKWLYLLSYFLQVIDENDWNLKLELRKLKSFVRYVEDKSVNNDYEANYKIGLEYFKSHLSEIKAVDVEHFVVADKIALAFMETIKYSDRVYINHAAASIIIYSTIGYFYVHSQENLNYKKDLTQLVWHILDKVRRDNVGRFDFSCIYSSRIAESDILVEVDKNDVLEYLNKLKSNDYLRSEYQRFAETFYSNEIATSHEGLQDVIREFNINTLDSIKVVQGLDYKDAILYTLIHVHDMHQSYKEYGKWKRIKRNAFDEGKSSLNNLMLSKYVGDKTIKMFPLSLLVDNNLLGRESIQFFNITEFKGDILYSIIIDMLILDNKLPYKSNYNELKSAAFQEALVKDWNIEKLVQSNGLVLINKKPFSTADYFESILFWYVEANGFEEGVDFIYNLIKNYDPKLCNTKELNEIPSHVLSKIYNSIKFGIDKLQASDYQLGRYIQRGEPMLKVKMQRKNYTYKDIKKIVENYMSNNITKKK